MLRRISVSLLLLLLLAPQLPLLRLDAKRLATRENHDESSFFVPLPYPDSFSIEFVTNILSLGDDDKRDFPIHGTLFYNWAGGGKRRQRIDHAPGLYECERFYHTTQGCTLLFLPEGMYRIIGDYDPSTLQKYNNNNNNNNNNNFVVVNPSCCLDLPGVGAPAPNWAALANPTFRGVVQDKYSGQLAYEWIFDHVATTSSQL